MLYHDLAVSIIMQVIKEENTRLFLLLLEVGRKASRDSRSFQVFHGLVP